MNKKLVQLLLTFLLISIELISYSYYDLSSVWVQSRTIPPKISFPRPRGTPSAKNATGSRGFCPKIFSLGGNPESDYTLTVSEYPTFWFYIPPSQDKISDLVFELQYKNAKNIDTVRVKIPTNSSLVPIRFSKVLPTNQKLFWYLRYECQISAELKQDHRRGLVERIVLTDELKRQLNIAQTPLKRFSIYTENGIWYDTLNELLTQPDLQEIRTKVFKEVGLEEIIHVPLRSTN